MKMKKCIILFIFFTLIRSISPAQNRHDIDSLQNELKKAVARKNAVGSQASPLMDSAEANILDSLSMEYWITKPDSALFYAKQEKVLSEKIGYKKGIGNSYIVFGVVGDLKKNMPLATENFQHALKIFEEIRYKPGIAWVYNNMAVMYLNRNNSTEAIRNFSISLKIWSETGHKKKAAETLRNIGNIYHLNLADYSKAQEYYQKSLKIYESTGDKDGIAYVRYFMGYAYWTTGNYPEALTNGLLALKNYDELGSQLGIAMSYEIIGKVYDSQGNYKNAISNFKKEIEICRKIANKKRLLVAYCNLGEMYFHQGEYFDAMTNELITLKFSEEAHDTNWIGISHIYLGDIYEKQSAYLKALSNYLFAVKIFEKANDKECLALAEIGAGIVFEKLGQLPEALKKVSRGLSLAQDINSRDDKRNAYKELAVINARLGNNKSAYENEVLYKQYYDSIYNKENERKLTSLQMQYDFDKKEQADSIQHASENKINLLNLHKQVAYTRIGVAGFILVVLLLFFVYRNYTNQRKATAKMAIARQRAEQSEMFKEQFLANMSHEIRTPMNAVIGMTNLVLDSQLNNKQRFYLEGVRKSSETLLRIINDILDLSKIEAGKMEMENIDFSLSEVLDQVKQTLQHKAEEKGLQLIVDIDSRVPDVLTGDPVRLNQVLMNLSGNAIKFTEKGSVTISVGRRQPAVGSQPLPNVNQESAVSSQQSAIGNRESGIGSQPSTVGNPVPLKFSVIDTGIGIPEDKLQTVFESFSQAKSSDSRKYGGTGLGLTISKQLVELMDGKISVESREGSGTTFSFEITCQPGSVSRLNESKSADQIEASVLDGLKILLADDNEYNRIVTSDTLRSKSKVEITEATNGREVVDLLSQQDFDLVLMDVQMPIMDGYEATRYIRTELPSPKNQVQVIALTASVIRSDLDKCREAGMNDYIPKPFKTSQLVSAIAKAAGREIRYSEKAIPGTGTALKAKTGVTDLTYLEKFCEGDKERMTRYIRMFLDTAPLLIEKINSAIEKNDFVEIANQIHGYKTKWIMMGMNETKDLAHIVEKQCREENNPAMIKENIISLISQIHKAVNELQVS